MFKHILIFFNISSSLKIVVKSLSRLKTRYLLSLSKFPSPPTLPTQIWTQKLWTMSLKFLTLPLIRNLDKTWVIYFDILLLNHSCEKWIQSFLLQFNNMNSNTSHLLCFFRLVKSRLNTENNNIDYILKVLNRNW